LRPRLHAVRVVLARLLLALEHLRVVFKVFRSHLGDPSELHDLRQVEDQPVALPHTRDLIAARTLEPEDIEPARLRDPHVLLRPNNDPVRHPGLPARKRFRKSVEKARPLPPWERGDLFLVPGSLVPARKT